MADKSCKNCGYEGCPVAKRTTTCCDNWQPNPPPKPDEVVEAEELDYILDYSLTHSKVEVIEKLIKWADEWARSKALESVEIDEMKLSKVNDEYACRFLDIADIKSIYKANPLKLKTK